MSDRVDRHTRNPKTITDLQVALYDWQVYNFGEQDYQLAYLGMCEEAGELCHACLKQEQGIRGTPLELEAKLRDAIGDICIYMMNYLSGIGLAIPSGQFTTRLDGGCSIDLSIRNAVICVYRAVAKVPLVRNGDHQMMQFAIDELSLSMLWVCSLKGWSLEEVIRETWTEVGKRDWRTYPETGMRTF